VRTIPSRNSRLTRYGFELSLSPFFALPLCFSRFFAHFLANPIHITITIMRTSSILPLLALALLVLALLAMACATSDAHKESASTTNADDIEIDAPRKTLSQPADTIPDIESIRKKTIERIKRAREAKRPQDRAKYGTFEQKANDKLAQCRAECQEQADEHLFCIWTCANAVECAKRALGRYKAVCQTPIRHTHTHTHCATND
jgi:hypothetical protein